MSVSLTVKFGLGQTTFDNSTLTAAIKSSIRFTTANLSIPALSLSPFDSTQGDPERCRTGRRVAVLNCREYILVGMKKHLAIMNKFAVEAVLSGHKTVETRFSKHRICPFGQVSVGDLVFMKLPGGDVIGQFRVKKVISYEGLATADLDEIFSKFGDQISMGDQKEDEKYRLEKVGSRFGTLIFISESERFITSPLKFKKSDQRGWVVLGG